MKKAKQKIIEYKKALIYCRVSSARQKIEGHGLESQELRCRAYALQKGYEVERVFKDDYTGGGDFMNRPAMAAIIAYLDIKQHENFVVIFDDLKRFARDTKFHWELRRALEVREAKPECLNYEFGEEPEDEFVETILAAQGELERKQNRRQVIQKMKARLEVGYWPFCPPPGLSNQKDAVKGKILKPVQPFAGIYKEAIERYRDYQLNTLEAVRNFILNKYNEFGIKKPLSLNGTKRILSELLYSGYLEYEPWEIKRTLGQHEGFISYETYLAVQDRLLNKAKPRLRNDYSPDFPARGFVLCGVCGKPMTAGWYKGNGKERKAYYRCKTVGCTMRGVPKEEMEKDIQELLTDVKPQKEILNLLEAIVKDVWQDRSKQEEAARSGTINVIADLEAKNATLLARITQSRDEALVSEYEKVVSKNLTEIKNLNVKLGKIKYPREEFKTALGAVVNYVESPLNQWLSNNFQRQRLLLSMYFEEKLTFDPNFGFKTVQLPLILELSRQKQLSKINLVPYYSEAKTYFEGAC